MNRGLRIAILKCFDSQSDFAQAIDIPESRVSQVIRGRRKLPKNQATIWVKVLKCNPDLLKIVTADS